jgi:hypothetical protein
MNCRVTLGALAIAVLLPLSLLGKDKPQPADDKLDKKVLEIVKQTGELYKNAKAIHAEGAIDSKMSGDGDAKGVKVSAVYEVARPLSLSLKTKIDGDATKGPDVVADGKKLFIHRKALNQYMEMDSPQTLGEVGLGLLGLNATNTGMLFGNILGDDPADLLMQGVTDCSYVGLDKVDGKPVHRMKFTQPEFEWELWVASEGKPYVLRFVSTREGQGGKIVTTETYKNWKLDSAPAQDTFTFKAPEGVKKVDEFSQPGGDK